MIFRRIRLIDKQISGLLEIKKELQKNCTHPKELLEIKSGGSSGNYDPSADLYWKDYSCNNCQQKWTIYK